MLIEEAVKKVLELAGETPVALPNIHPNTTAIEGFLQTALDNELDADWDFSIEGGMLLQPDVDTQEVAVASDLYVHLLFADPHTFIRRGDKVFNRVDRTYKHDGPVEVIRVTRRLSWEEVPRGMQIWCVYQAARLFVGTDQGDELLMNEYKEEALKAYNRLRAQDIRDQQVNVYNTPQIRKVRTLVAPKQRGGIIL